MSPDEPGTSGATAEKRDAGDRRPVKSIFVLLLAGVGVLAWLLWPGDDDAGSAILASGTVEATQASLGFQAAGRIAGIHVREGAPVRERDLLAELDRTGAEAWRDRAEAEIRAAEAALRELRTGSRPEEVAQAEAEEAAALERLEDARRDLERTRILFEGGAVSREALDKARLALRSAETRHRQAAEQLSLVRQGPRPERIEAQEARLEAARAALRSAEATLEDMTVRAPFDGVVTVRHGQPGETAAPGAPILTLMDPEDRWVRIYVREDRIGALRLGQEAAISSDTYPERSYPGEVSFVASEAEFTPKNVQTREERVRLVFAVDVRVLDDPGQELKPGMPADVRIEVEER